MNSINSFSIDLLKWFSTMRISLSKMMAYRMALVLQILAPGIVFFILKYYLWKTIYEGQGSNSILEGLTFQQMILYHLAIFLNHLICASYNSVNLAEDIRLGRISTYLIYPFSFLKFHFASFLAFQILQVFISCTTIGLLYLFIPELMSTPSFMVQGLIYSFCLGPLWFFLQFIIGVLGFWLDETWSLRVILMFSTAFLAGEYFPLSFFPEMLQQILKWTPFPYMGHFAAKTYLGELSLFGPHLGIIFLWTAFFFIVSQWIWGKGLKRYSGAGI